MPPSVVPEVVPVELDAPEFSPAPLPVVSSPAPEPLEDESGD
ncbi:MAG TPA: hypothetical protein VF989_19610 [Polyangiaceae bacterium]